MSWGIHYEGEAIVGNKEGEIAYFVLQGGILTEAKKRAAHKLCFAVNSYEKHCGSKTEQLAKEDLLGQALSLVRSFANCSSINTLYALQDEASTLLEQLEKQQ